MIPWRRCLARSASISCGGTHIDPWILEGHYVEDVGY